MPPAEPSAAESAALLRSDWGTPPPPRRFLVDGYLARGRVAMVSGDGGGGKSILAIQLAFNIAADPPSEGGRRWFPGGPEIDGGAEPIVFASWEDEHDEIQRRLLNNPEIDGAPALGAHLGDRFAAFDASDCGPIWTLDGGRAQGRLSDFGAELQRTCEDRGAGLLVLDALDSANGGSEIDRASVRAFLGCWDAWGRRNDCTVLIVAHPPKNGAKYSGSTAWRNGVRTLLHFERPNEADDKAILTIDKANYAKAGAKLVVTGWRWWQASAEDPANVASAVDDEISDAIMRALERESPLSQRKLCDAVGSRHDRVRKVAGDLVNDGTLTLDMRTNGYFYSLSASRAHPPCDA